MTTDRPLALDVADFGPIARACVELRPLTVFVGPSNTLPVFVPAEGFVSFVESLCRVEQPHRPARVFSLARASSSATNRPGFRR